MAFLDNSGDIILDAVLTDVGRKRMAQGRFRISKFALGDDEIDYTLYDKTHPSGAAYYDLEILQTPIFEAMPGSSLSYGLTSYTRNDLLYTPDILLNGLIVGSALPTGNVYYLAANQETSTKLKTHFGNEQYVLHTGDGTSTKLIYEIGLNTGDIAATRDNKRSYLSNTNLADRKIHVQVDNRFINGVMGNSARAVFSNTTDGKLNVNLGALTSVNATSISTTMKNHNTYVLNAVSNNITDVDSVDISQYTAIAGAKSSAGAMNFSIPVEMRATSTGKRDTKYDLYGTVNEALLGGSDKYDYIDTTAYVEGATSTAQMQIPLRIIRYAGT